MPHYYFHSADHHVEVDRTGIELPDLIAARVEAIRYAGDLLKDEPDVLKDGQSFRVEVTDEERKWLFTVAMLAIDAPVVADGSSGR